MHLQMSMTNPALPVGRSLDAALWAAKHAAFLVPHINLPGQHVLLAEPGTRTDLELRDEGRGSQVSRQHHVLLAEP
jgi:hypothetical protein